MRGSSSLIFVPLVLAASAAGATTSVSGKQDAQSAFEEGDFAEARKILERLVAQSPNDADILRRLAAVEAAAGDLAAARGHIDRAAANAPFDKDVKVARANILYWSGNIAAAERAISEVASEAPDYPGVKDLQADLSKSKEQAKLRLGLATLGAEVSRVSFLGDRTVGWEVQRGGVSARWGSSNWATFQLEREERDAVDVRGTVKVDVAVSEHRVFLTGSATPSADFRERWSAGAGVELALTGDSTFLADGKVADYEAGQVGSGSLGVRHEFSEYVSLTAKSIHLVGGGSDYRLGGSLRFDLKPTKGVSFFTLGAAYPDVEADGTRQMRSVAGGIRLAVSEEIEVALTAGVDDRKDSYRRDSVGLDLVWRPSD